MSSAEIIGLLAGAIVLLSFIPKNNILLTRSINTVGAILFVAYGIWISAWSVWILNSLCVIINITYIIIELVKRKKVEKKNDNN